MKYVKVAIHNIIPHIDKIDNTVVGLIINNSFKIIFNVHFYYIYIYFWVY